MSLFADHPTLTCGAVITNRKNRGKVCGRAVIAFVAPGHGRCGLHDSIVERTRTLAILRAIRDVRELRGLAADPEERGQHREEPDDDEPTDSEPTFNVTDFLDPSLDEE